jgi:hypothetical protein
MVDDDDAQGKGKDNWRAALNSIKAAVQEATRLRGLGPMNFG